MLNNSYLKFSLSKSIRIDHLQSRALTLNKKCTLKHSSMYRTSPHIMPSSSGHSTAPKFWCSGESQVPPGSGHTLLSERCKGAMFPSSQRKLRLDSILLTRSGFQSLHVICPIFVYLSPANTGVAEGERPFGVTHGSGWRATGFSWCSCNCSLFGPFNI